MSELMLPFMLTHLVFLGGSIVLTVYFLRLILIKNRGMLENQTNLARAGTRINFVSLTAVFITRWFYYGYFPVNNFYESCFMLSWIILFWSMVYFIRSQDEDTDYDKLVTVLMGIVAQGFTTFSQGIATLSVLKEIMKPTTLVPALKSLWLIMHVSSMILAYAALLLGSLLAVFILVFHYRKNHLWLKNFYAQNRSYSPPEQEKNIFKIMYKEIYEKFFLYLFNKYEAFAWDDFRIALSRFYLIVDEKDPLGDLVDQMAEPFGEYQLLYNLVDKWSYSMIRFGFYCLTIGILSGAVWANQSWGSYWSWDPKETFSLITWVIYGIYFHIRKRQPQTQNLEFCSKVAVVGFVILCICYFGLNLFPTGLHSYGTFDSF